MPSSHHLDTCCLYRLTRLCATHKLLSRALPAARTRTKNPPEGRGVRDDYAMNWGVIRIASKTAVALRPYKPKKLARAYACFLVYVARRVFL